MEVPPPPVSKELKRRWSYFIRKVYETDPLVCPKCSGEMHIISLIDQRAVIEWFDGITTGKILQHLGLWEDSLRLGSGQTHAPPERSPPGKELTFDPSYSQMI